MNERQQSGRPLAASRRDARVIVMVVLALLGAWISFNLTRYHLAGSGHGGSGAFHTVCEMTGGGCDQILKSTWSTLPRQIPTAFVGLIYFSAVALWYLAVGRPNRAGRPWFVPIFALQVFGVLFSLFLIAVMLEARALCGWCAFTHVLNFVLLGLAWTFWRAPDATGFPAWPPARLGLAALLLVVLTGAFWERWLLTRYLFAEIEHFQHDTDLMRYLHIRNPQQAIPIRADDPARGAATAPHTLVVFSDFQCPACRNFAGFYETRLRPLFGDRLRLVFKHLPLDTRCNPQMRTALHPRACEAAHAVEAARELGGPEAFWKMHDALFQRQREVAGGSWAEVASGIGLDGAAVAERVAQRKHLDRIQGDVQLGAALKMSGTPGIFLDGRHLQNWMDLDLWKAILAAPGAPREAAGTTAPDTHQH